MAVYEDVGGKGWWAGEDQVPEGLVETLRACFLRDIGKPYVKADSYLFAGQVSTRHSSSVCSGGKVCFLETSREVSETVGACDILKIGGFLAVFHKHSDKHTRSGRTV